MKIVAFCFIVLMLLSLDGCKKDDPAPDLSALLIGVWEATNLVATGCTDPSENQNETCTSACEVLVITATTISFDGEGPFNYTASGNTLTIDFGGITVPITYEITEPTITFTHQASVADGGCKTVSTYGKAITDADGNVYHAIKIGTQTWLQENLKTTRYRNGDAIPNTSDETQWKNASAGAYCNYNNDAFTGAQFGLLYNWYAVNDARKIAPQGWHVATDAEWNTLVAFLGGESVAGGKLKDEGGLWQSPNTGASNESNFSAIPAGTRYPEGPFDNFTLLAYFWSSTEIGADAAWYRYLIWEDAGVHHFGHQKQSGFSVRCVKD